MMVWGAIGYTSRSPVVRTAGTLNSVRYFSGVFRPVVLPFIRALQKPMFQKKNTRPQVDSIEWTVLDSENNWLLPWPARSPDLSPIENVRSMVVE
ncbi:transposable element Tcb1 transposase [Trichonephila clavipes]|nr:transposable element Tcb1 transposase [Trichonephila clavipes]